MSWLPIPSDSDFTLANIPFGVFRHPITGTGHPAIAIGEHLLDLHVFSTHGGFSQLPEMVEHLEVFKQPTLNAFAALGQKTHRAVRAYLQQVLTADSPLAAVLQYDETLQKQVLFSQDAVEMLLPMEVGDYTDFYAGRTHAFNVGCLFRGTDNALQKNYEQLPVGYHGRASSVVISGTPIMRPNGQTAEGVMEKCKRLDLELEMAAFVARGNKLGEPMSVVQARENLFGFALMNDWSARDIQAFEYVPLGPFTSKNFGTTISSWIVLPCALENFKALPLQRTSTIPVQKYLLDPEEKSVYDIALTVEINGATLTKTSSKNLLWSFPQMLAHHTVTGCNMRTGDLLGSGTISGEGVGEAGCLLEATKGGKEPVALGGVQRTWLQDGDEVVIKGFCGEGETRVGWGECKGVILPALDI
ncbi:fumarylacetoacetase [Sphaerosporella brunnea]|uniref:Fumarylacetoacetase n=1 Tax=Sphaerosporella brunnea TaxID=1250544 RepID=A0A5J5ER54_9PEZI|nr:fumarylacetoacetase [Sphaerosporella brunnea]